MVSALVSGSSGPDGTLAGDIVLCTFLGKTLYFHIASLNLGV